MGWLWIDFTVNIEVKLDNMRIVGARPDTVDARGQESVELVSLTPRDPEKQWHYTYEYHWAYGSRGGRPDGAVYVLPYPPAESHKLIQGYYGRYSHYSGSQNENAYDWRMPVGSTVCAARDGVVIGVRKDSQVGGPSSDFKMCANYVMVRHSDGTYAEYLHLRRDGVLVAVGDSVKAGQAIAFSGNTGFTSEPHLHFCVFRPIDALRRETLPVPIRTKSGVLEPLSEGETY